MQHPKLIRSIMDPITYGSLAAINHRTTIHWQAAKGGKE